MPVGVASPATGSSAQHSSSTAEPQNKMAMPTPFKQVSSAPPTSAVHDLAHHGGGEDLATAQEVGELAPDGNDDGHHHVGDGGQDPHLKGGDPPKTLAENTSPTGSFPWLKTYVPQEKKTCMSGLVYFCPCIFTKALA